MEASTRSSLPAPSLMVSAALSSLKKAGASIDYLTSSWRTRPPLLGYLNTIFGHAFAADGIAKAEVELRAQRNDVLDGPGAVDAVRELTGGRGAELVFDFVGTDQTHADAMAMLARGGDYSVIGYGGMVHAPSVALVGNEHSVVGNLVGTWIDLWELLQLHVAGRITLLTETHPLDDVNDVLAKLREAEE